MGKPLFLKDLMNTKTISETIDNSSIVHATSFPNGPAAPNPGFAATASLRPFLRRPHRRAPAPPQRTHFPQVQSPRRCGPQFQTFSCREGASGGCIRRIATPVGQAAMPAAASVRVPIPRRGGGIGTTPWHDMGYKNPQPYLA